MHSWLWVLTFGIRATYDYDADLLPPPQTGRGSLESGPIPQ